MFWKKKKKEIKEFKTEIDKITDAMVILEELGLHITDIQASKEFIEKARKNKGAIDANGNNMGLLNMDTTFSCWVDKKIIPCLILKKKGKDFEGMMFGINFRCREND